MISLIQGFWKSYFEKPGYKILIIGLDGSGKTVIFLFSIFKKCYLNKIKQSAKQKFLAIEKIAPTIGLNLTEIEYKQDQYKIIYWDLGGTKILRSIWKKYYQEAQGVVFIIDGQDQFRDQENKDCFNEINNDPDLNQVPFLILINKMDETFDEDSVKQKYQMLLSCDNITNHKLNIQCCSVLNNFNLKDGNKWLHNQIIQIDQFLKHKLK